MPGSGVAVTRLGRSSFVIFNDTATPEIYTLPLHDALPISSSRSIAWSSDTRPTNDDRGAGRLLVPDRKSTRLNSSHGYIRYAVFCLKRDFGVDVVSYDVQKEEKDSPNDGAHAPE